MNRNGRHEPTEAERQESLAREIRWRADYQGLTYDGAAERAAELSKMTRPPAFTPAPVAAPPKTKKTGPRL